MSLPRFFLNEQVLSDIDESRFILDLNEDDLHHLHVLRLDIGERVAVVDGDSDYFICQIEAFEGKRPVVSIAERGRAGRARPSVELFQALPKQSKLDEVVRHGTEIGVDGFHPFLSRRCVAKLDEVKSHKRLQRWQQVARSAAMQSGRNHVPEVHALASFEAALEDLLLFDAVLLFWEETEGSDTIAAALAQSQVTPQDADKRIAVVIGSEGGFEEDEVRRILDGCSHAHCLSLGDTILRTETAGIVGSALVIYEVGGLGNGRG